MSERPMDQLSEISLELLMEDNSHILDSYITLVYKYYGKEKVYLFYTYCIDGDNPLVFDNLTKFLDAYNANAMDAEECHETPLLIFKGMHETLRLCKPNPKDLDSDSD